MKKRVHIKSKVTKGRGVESGLIYRGETEELEVTIFGEHNAVLKATYEVDADVDDGEMVDLSYWSFELISTDHPPWQGLDRISGRNLEEAISEAIYEISPELEITPSDDEIVLGMLHGDKDF